MPTTPNGTLICRTSPFANARFFSVPASADLPEAFWVALLERLATLRDSQ